ncbi:MAG: patatin-like phospholipase family protein [Nitrospirales bacterium]
MRRTVLLAIGVFVILWFSGNAMIQHPLSVSFPLIAKLLGGLIYIGMIIWFFRDHSLIGRTFREYLKGFLFPGLVAAPIIYGPLVLGSHDSVESDMILIASIIYPVVFLTWFKVHRVNWLEKIRSGGLNVDEFFSPFLETSILQKTAWITLAGLLAWGCLALKDKNFHSTPIDRDKKHFFSSEPQGAIGLALSGGGYRAALYHAGILKGLEDIGYRPTHLSTVSGGSIIGAFYAIGGDPCDFHSAVVNKHFNLKRDLFELHNAIRIMAPFEVPFTDTKLWPFNDFNRLDIQKEILNDFLFKDTRLENIGKDGTPKLLINTTDLHYGLLVGFSPNGAFVSDAVTSIWWPGQLLPQTQGIDWGHLAELVAISGAFPGAFPATPLAVPDGNHLLATEQLSLSDGGVLDNSGVVLLQSAHRLTLRRRQLFSVAVTSEKNKRLLTLISHQKLIAWKKRQEEIGLHPPTGWKLDVILAADGGQVFKEERDVSGLQTIDRAVSLSGLYGQMPLGEKQEDDAPIVSLFPHKLLSMVNGKRSISKDFVNRFSKRVTQERFNQVPDLSFGERVGEWFSSMIGFEQIDKKTTVFDEKTFYCDAGQGELLSAISQDEEWIHKAVMEDIQHVVNVFENSNTLKDQYSQAEASAIFRLGVYVVFDQYDVISKVLK